MPIRPENKGRYPKDWKAISKRIREERAKNQCEQCRAPNGEFVARGVNRHAGTYMLPDGEVRSEESGETLGYARGSEYCARGLTKIVLTVAHLDHTPENNAEENLKALCQKCHLNHDRDEHKRTRARTRRNHTRELFA